MIELLGLFDDVNGSLERYQVGIDLVLLLLVLQQLLLVLILPRYDETALGPQWH
jgi:hypothetical protein